MNWQHCEIIGQTINLFRCCLHGYKTVTAAIRLSAKVDQGTDIMLLWRRWVSSGEDA